MKLRPMLKASKKFASFLRGKIVGNLADRRIGVSGVGEGQRRSSRAGNEGSRIGYKSQRGAYRQLTSVVQSKEHVLSW